MKAVNRAQLEAQIQSILRAFDSKWLLNRHIFGHRTCLIVRWKLLIPPGGIIPN